MIGNLFTVADPAPAALRVALADLLALSESAVDVADADGAQEGRNWEAPVLCTYRRLPPGDLLLELDVTVEERTAGRLTEGSLARGLAVRTGGSVLHPSAVELPSAYWVATVDGRSVRCRLEAVDRDEDTAYRVDAVEEPVADLPGAKIETLPEILDRERIETPVADAFLAGYPTGTTATVQGRVHYALRVWERLVRRMESDWSPSGRYRQDLFGRDLEARDDLASAAGRVGAPYAEGLCSAVAQLDAVYREYTDENADCGRGGTAEGWWWRRCPRRVPW
ncbi:hypothetical protein ACFW88_29175 [Streptomyces anandii]|uniref:Uncharacterized protein n=1 Tax=Streptomyces anandii TaxID=285454 RepID=A0ABW6HD52_9ACTN